MDSIANVHGLYRKAERYFACGNWNRARQYYAQLVQMFPTDFTARYMYAAASMCSRPITIYSACRTANAFWHSYRSMQQLVKSQEARQMLLLQMCQSLHHAVNACLQQCAHSPQQMDCICILLVCCLLLTSVNSPASVMQHQNGKQFLAELLLEHLSLCSYRQLAEEPETAEQQYFSKGMYVQLYEQLVLVAMEQLNISSET